MKGFIKVTEGKYNKKIIVININHIISYYKSSDLDTTTINLVSGKHFEVNESVEEITKEIIAAQKAGD